MTKMFRLFELVIPHALFCQIVKSGRSELTARAHADIQVMEKIAKLIARNVLRKNVIQHSAV